MLKLPPRNHPARQLFDVNDLAERASPENRGKLPTLREARKQAEEAFKAAEPPRTITYIVLRATGDIHLVSFGRKGRMRIEWMFGQ